MLNPISLPSLRLLCILRWLAILGQAITVAVVTGPMHMTLAAGPLWAGVIATGIFNVYATLRSRATRQPSEGEVFGHVLVDIGVLTWMIGWSGGIENPFSSLFLLPIALSIFALSGKWIWFTAIASMLGYGISAWSAAPLPHVHGTFGDVFSLHKLGMLANFVVSATVVLIFLTRMALAWRDSERQVAQLRERFTRNEGIIALATHAASVAHELNTPLATLTLMVEDLACEPGSRARHEDYTTMRTLLESCRDRVRELASPAFADAKGTRPSVDLDRVIEGWRLVRPTIELHRTGASVALKRVDPAVGHLIQALLNNAADASEALGESRVDLHIDTTGEHLHACVRDYGPGFEQSPPVLPGILFRTSKADGMGIGLVLSHATVERLGGTLSMQAAQDGPGVVVSFRLPLGART